MIWDIKRCAAHIPVGWIQSWITYRNPVAGGLFAAGFALYELNEDRHIRDRAFVDYQGALIGMALEAFWEHRKRNE